jgi:hypothetical protein
MVGHENLISARDDLIRLVNSGAGHAVNGAALKRQQTARAFAM